MSAFRETAATALTVKAADNIVALVENLRKVDPATLGTAPADIEKLKKDVGSLASMRDLTKQLAAAKASVPGAEQALEKLIRARNDLLSWMDTLCPEFTKTLEEIQAWADAIIPKGIEGKDCKAAADACPTESLKLPQCAGVQFWLRSDLAALVLVLTLRHRGCGCLCICTKASLL